MENDPIFEPLQFRHLSVKNRIFRSNISGRFDYYNGAGSQARINFEERYARGGVENDFNAGLSSTRQPEPLHGFPAQAMTRDEIHTVTRYFADGARRARAGVGWG